MSENIGKSSDEIPDKRQKFDNDRSQPSRSSEQNDPSPRIFKLNIDCFDELFEYLSTADLLALSRTCKTMQQVVGVYARDNYSNAAKINMRTFNREISRKLFERVKNRIERSETIGFNKFIRFIVNDESGTLKYLGQSHEFTSAKRLFLSGTYMVLNQINNIQNVLNRLEVIQIRYCKCQSGFYESCLRYCVNLKRLYILDSESIIKSSGNDWLQKVYPSLEHLEMVPRRRWDFNVTELTRFFQLNPNVRSFSTISNFLLNNRIEFVESGIKLEILEVIIIEILDQRRIREFLGLLNELFDRGFYQLLHLYVNGMNKDFINEMKSLPGLVKLCIKHVSTTHHSLVLPNVIDLGIMGGSFDAKILVQRFVNLQQIYLQTTTDANIWIFIRHLAKLKRIIVNYIECSESILIISALNTERKKLENAQKVTIYVPDHIFIPIKWFATHGDLNLSLIEIQRSDSYRWDLYYDRYFR